jgi:hypothetical protein
MAHHILVNLTLSPPWFIMADVTEKDNSGSDDNSGSHIAIYERPTGIKGVYYHPITQVSMLGFVCFMCPGITQGEGIRFNVLFTFFLQVSSMPSQDWALEDRSTLQPMQKPTLLSMPLSLSQHFFLGNHFLHLNLLGLTSDLQLDQ